MGRALGELRVTLAWQPRGHGWASQPGGKRRGARSPALFAACSHSFWDFLRSREGSPLGRRQHIQVVRGGPPQTRGFLCFLSPAPSLREGWRNSWLCWTSQPANVTGYSSLKVKTKDLQSGGRECERPVEGEMGREGAEETKISSHFLSADLPDFALHPRSCRLSH